MGLANNSLDVVDTYTVAFTQQTDEQLAVQAARGDQAAFAALYERYFDGLYDFALRIVHDPDMTADIVQASFVKAWQHLQTGKVPKNIKAWLYTVGRNASIDEYRYRKRLVDPGQGEAEERLYSSFADIGSKQMSDPHTQIEDKELAELVWRSAAALRPKEYALLDMHVRQELSVEELAESLGLSKGTVYTRLSRLRDSLEESVVTVLLMNQGRRNCPELNAILTELQATEPTRRVRWAIREHLDECYQCQESKRRYASPLAILAALVSVPAPIGLEQLIWSRVSSQPGLTQLGSGDSFFYRWLSRLGSYRKEIILALLVQFLVIGAGGALALSFGRAVDPDDVHSTSHEIGQPSTENIIEMAWSFLPNAAAYSILWSQAARDLPDTEVDLPGGARLVSSPALPAGDWYFHLRTQGRNGKWTSTVHLGPFRIISSQPVLLSPPTPTPTVILPAVPTDNSPPLLPTAAVATDLPEPAVTQNPSGPQPTSEALVVNDLLVTTIEDVPVTIFGLIMATGADIQLVPTSFSVVNGPAYGITLENIETGDVVYVPAPDFNGSDSFSYEICDDEGACDTATVNLEVTPVNDRPVAIDDHDRSRSSHCNPGAGQ
jgi:RNA polymerase sigma factor (sigma-70 family)